VSVSAGTLAIIGATLAQTTEAIAVQGFPALIPFALADLPLTKAGAGMLASAFFAGALVSVVPVGRLIDRVGIRRSLTLGLGLMAVCVSLASLSRSFPYFYFCLFLSGIGFGSVYPATTKAVMLWAPRRLRGTMMGVKQTGDPLGGALSSALLPRLASCTSWRCALLAAGAVCFGGMTGCRALFRTHSEEPPVCPPVLGQADKVPGAGAGGTSVSLLLRNRDVWLVNVSGLLFLGIQVTVVSWLVVYLMEWSTVSVAASCLTALQVGGAIGRVGWGPVSDILLHGRRKPAVLLLGVLTALSLLGLSAIAGAGNPVMLSTCFVVGLTSMGWIGVLTVLRAELVPPEGIGAATGLGVLTGCIGSLVGPPLLGILVDHGIGFGICWRALSIAAFLAGLFAMGVRSRQA